MTLPDPVYQNAPSEANVKSIGVAESRGSAHSVVTPSRYRPMRWPLAAHHTPAALECRTYGRVVPMSTAAVTPAEVTVRSPVDPATKTSLPVGAAVTSVGAKPAGSVSKIAGVIAAAQLAGGTSRAILFAAVSVYQSAPSLPRAIAPGCASPDVFGVTTPAGVMQSSSPVSDSTTHIRLFAATRSAVVPPKSSASRDGPKPGSVRPTWRVDGSAHHRLPSPGPAVSFVGADVPPAIDCGALCTPPRPICPTWAASLNVTVSGPIPVWAIPVGPPAELHS